MTQQCHTLKSKSLDDSSDTAARVFREVLFRLTALFSCGSSHQVQLTGWLKNNRNVFSAVLESRSLKSVSLDQSQGAGWTALPLEALENPFPASSGL